MRELSPDAVDVRVLDHYKLKVSFDNGEVRIFDVKPLLDRKCYVKLKNPRFFSMARVEYGCVTWPENIDIDPEWLYEDSCPVN
ncbi:MAG: DUF2442 domain-containing protein [Clostridia bacterium]|nr:DUF2442 domain-containing protein [Clostridia bacterium]